MHTAAFDAVTLGANIVKAILIVLVLMASTTAMAHSGGTDAAGCHYNHKTGVYHCH